MFLAYLTLATALAISAVAIYYSVVGLVAIFAAAAIPIIVMGSTLEVAKLVVAVWLHKYWSQTVWWLKSYLAVAVIILMFITSMGIFGFLSKAHIEQTSVATESLAQLERTTSEISQLEQVIARAETRISELETSGTGASVQIQDQIDREQARIDVVYERIQQPIDRQTDIIQQQTAVFTRELNKIDEDLALLQSYIDSGEYAKAQSMVGARADGVFGPNTAAIFREYQSRKQQERLAWIQRIEESENSAAVTAARAEITRLRAQADAQAEQSNLLINNLRNQLKTGDNNNLQSLIDEQNKRIVEATSRIDELYAQQFGLEAEYRKLEAEVGPIKYIAEMIYGNNTDKDMLEEAVRWVIIIIIFVFDPLAVLLLIASQYTFNYAKAQRISDVEDKIAVVNAELDEVKKLKSEVSSELAILTNMLKFKTTTTIVDEPVTEVDDEELDDNIEAEPVPDPDQLAASVAQYFSPTEVKEEEDDTAKKSDIEYLEESPQERERRETYEQKEQDHTFVLGKHNWKDANPDKTLKHYKNLYIKGLIDQLPWEETPSSDNYKDSR